MPLPYCHSRREFPNDATVFFCAHPRLNIRDQIVTAVICQACKLWREPPPVDFRPFNPESAIRRDGRCAYLGEQIGWRECPTCRGNVQLKVFTCRHARHESTTYQECEHCTDYENDKANGLVQPLEQTSSPASSSAGSHISHVPAVGSTSPQENLLPRPP